MNQNQPWVPTSQANLNAAKDDVVQLAADDDIGEWFRGKLGFIDEVKGWGVVIRIEVMGGDTYYRADWGKFAVIGQPWWIKVMEGGPVRFDQNNGGGNERGNTGTDGGLGQTSP